MSDENYDMIFKLVLIGDSSVGKTNIMSKYLKNEFHEDSKATVGVEFGSKKFEIDSKSIKAQIWDTAGQERYKSITNAYYKGAKGAFVVYDITRKESFESIDKWINDLINSSDKNITILLIGNKCDFFKIAFMETSALNGQNLDKAFDLMMKEVYKKCHKEMEEEDDLEGLEAGEEIQIGKKNEGNDKKKCC